MATVHTTCRPYLVRCGIVAETDEAGRLRRRRPFPGLEMARRPGYSLIDWLACAARVASMTIGQRHDHR